MSLKNLIRISAAGSGKTWQICHDALAAAYRGERSLITTFTNKGVESIKNEIQKQNKGILHENIVICSWFQFLLCDLIRPFQTVITNINEVKGFDFSEEHYTFNYYKSGEKKRYLSKDGKVKANYASEFALQIIDKSQQASIDRLEKCYRYIFIDEIQDLAGDDLSILLYLLKSSITITCSGDNKQATYKTHNARKNKSKSGKNVWVFIREIENKKMAFVEYSLESRRCNKEICIFANSIFPNENNISSIMNLKTDHDGVFLINREDVFKYYDCYSPQALRYDVKTDVYGLDSYNFGQCKGMTFDRVLVFPNNPLINFVCFRNILTSPEKYYVAATRAKFSLTIVLDDISKCSDSFVDAEINLRNGSIKAKRWVITNE